MHLLGLQIKCGGTVPILRLKRHVFSRIFFKATMIKKLQVWAVTEYINSYTSILVSSWYNSDSDSLFLLFLSSPRISFVDEHILLVRLILAHLSWNNHKWISEIKNRAPNALGDRRRLMNIAKFDLNQFL